MRMSEEENDILFEMMFEYLNENNPNFLGQMIESAKREANE